MIVGDRGVVKFRYSNIETDINGVSVVVLYIDKKGVSVEDRDIFHHSVKILTCVDLTGKMIISVNPGSSDLHGHLSRPQGGWDAGYYVEEALQHKEYKSEQDDGG